MPVMYEDSDCVSRLNLVEDVSSDWVIFDHEPSSEHTRASRSSHAPGLVSLRTFSDPTKAVCCAISMGQN